MKRFMILLTILVLLSVTFGVVFTQKEEVERYSIAMEITHCEKTTIYKKHFGAEVHYSFSLYGDDKALTIDVSPQIYAQYKEGEWVEVEFIEYEYTIFHWTKQEINILGDVL